MEPNSNLPALRPDYSPMVPVSGGEPPAPVKPIVRVRRFLRVLKSFWWIPILTVALGAGGYYLYLRSLPPSYVSRASMWETEKLRLPDGAAFTGDAQTYRSTQMELLRNDALQQRALERLTALNAAAKPPRGADGKPVIPSINVLLVPKSTIFIVEATSSDAAFAKAYLDALVQEYLEYKKDVRKTVSGDTLASISEQVQRLERDLKNDQDTLTAFQQTNNLAILREEARTAGAYLARLDTELADYRFELQMLSGGVAPGTTNVVEPVLDARPNSGTRSLASDPERLNASRTVQLLRMQREKLSRYLRPKHPKIVKLDAELERAEKVDELFRAQTKEQIANARATLQLKIASTEQTLADWQRKVMVSNARIAQAEKLQLNVSRTEALYNRLVSLLQNVDLSRNIDQDTFAILAPASDAARTFAREDSARNKALLGGFAAGFGILLLLSLREDRFSSLAEVTDSYGGAIVGQVPEMPKPKRGQAMPLIQLEDDRPMYAESYRALRSALLFMADEPERPKTLLITSAVPHEGKSTIAANLARTLALGGSRVLLIDADLRRGYLHDLMGLNRGPGLSDLLKNPDSFDQVVQTNCLQNLSFISRGESVPNPGDLFLSRTLDRLIANLRDQYDCIIIDSSPVFAADDAATLAPKMDATLFVVRNRVSRATAVKEALELLNQRRAKVLGLVVNGADTSADSYHYYKYSEYYSTDKVGKA